VRSTTSRLWRAALLGAALILALGCKDRTDGVPLLLQADEATKVSPSAAAAAITVSAQVQAPARRYLVPAGRGHIGRHILSIPPGLDAPDGNYDLAIHFHGNTKAVEESYRLAKIRAVLLIVNLGEGADRYRDAFPSPTTLEGLLRKVNEDLAGRGVPHPRLRRLALSAWSAGYGAVLTILQQPEHRPLIDAVLLFDGLHARFQAGTGKVDENEVRPFVELAEDAAAGRTLFLVTHSAITPVNTELASVGKTSDALLEHVGVKRLRTTGQVRPRKLEAIRGVYGDKSLVTLRAESVAVKKGLMIIAYDGISPEHHIAHLLQMSQIGLPRLALRWKNPP
jgi:hypothetical protein